MQWKIITMENAVMQYVDILEARKNANSQQAIPAHYNECEEHFAVYDDDALSSLYFIACKNHIPCGLLSTECTAMQIMQSLIANFSGVPWRDLESVRLNVTQVKKIRDTAGQLYEAPLALSEVPLSTPEDLHGAIDELVNLHGVKIIFFIVRVPLSDHAIFMLPALQKLIVTSDTPIVKLHVDARVKLIKKCSQENKWTILDYSKSNRCIVQGDDCIEKGDFDGAVSKYAEVIGLDTLDNAAMMKLEKKFEYALEMRDKKTALRKNF